jgi:hypothetical protein
VFASSVEPYVLTSSGLPWQNPPIMDWIRFLGGGSNSSMRCSSRVSAEYFNSTYLCIAVGVVEDTMEGNQLSLVKLAGLGPEYFSL